MAESRATDALLEGLNPAQQEAVLHKNGPAMIIAGAGSGKTRVLTHRIAYLMQLGVDPFNILSLTFTNKASREMRKRIEKVVGTDARNLWMGTFHSVFARILRSEAPHIGYPSNFTIYDTQDSKSLIRSIVKEMNLDDKLYKVNLVLSRISGAKNRLVSVSEYLRNPVYAADDAENRRPAMGKIYKAYQDRCFKANAMDFDDLLFNTNVLFKNHVDVLNKYQNRFHYVMVDEFQDTNISQYLITRKLAAKNQNIVVVGDDAQSIYAFRGADIQNILNFEKDYADLKVFKLEQNYRSTKTIVEAANSIIGKNTAQLKKDVWTANDEGMLIELLKANSDNEEGKLVANSIFEEKSHGKMSYADFAILYRTNAQSRSMEEALRRLNIKYRIIGGLSFYQRKEIKDLIAYLRYTVNPDDEEGLKRIINTPKRGIGDVTISKIFVAANDHGISVWEVLQNARSFFPGRVGNALTDFSIIIRRFQDIAREKDAFVVASEIAKVSGLLRELYEDKSIEGLARYENVQELLNGVKEFVDNPEVNDHSLGAFLQDIALLTDADTKDDGDEKVTLMTIHSAKGLEFRNVYIVGMEEDLFPSQMMLESRADLEEERRLFYVAVTRAEHKLTLSYAVTRYRFGRLKPCEPSRFLKEIEPRYLKVSRSFTPDVQTTSLTNLVKRGPKPTFSSTKKTTSGYKAPADFQASDTSTLTQGMKVEHPKFGYGMVTALDVNGSDRKAVVEFDDFGEKTLLLSFAKLRIH